MTAVIPRILRKEAVVTVRIPEIWKAWTSVEGVSSFLAPRANIELNVGGAYELLFEPEAPVGFQGTEGCKVLEIHPETGLSFEFTAPPQFPNVRRLKTRVELSFDEVQNNAMNRVTLSHSGFLAGEEWDAAYMFFDWSWDLVLARFQHRFSVGPINWKNPFRPYWLSAFPERRIRDHISARTQ